MRGKLAFLVFLLVNPLSSLKIIVPIIRDVPVNKNLFSRLIKLFVMLYVISHHYRRKPDHHLILDQGILQLICSIYFPYLQHDVKHIDTVIKNAILFLGKSRPYRIVKVETSIARAMQRVYSREKPTCYFKRMSDWQLTEILSQYSLFFDNVSPDLTVNSEHGIDDNGLTIYESLFAHG